MGRGRSNINSVRVRSERIRQEFLEHGINSRFKGVQRDAKAGTGAYTYKNAEPVDVKTALKMSPMILVERDGKTLAHGVVNGKAVFIADSNNSSTIKQLKAEYERRSTASAESSKRRESVELKGSSTYERWRKRNAAKVAAFYGR